MKRNTIRAAAFAATMLAVSIASAVDASPMQSQDDSMMSMHSRMGSSSGKSMCGGMGSSSGDSMCGGMGSSSGKSMCGGMMGGMMGSRGADASMSAGRRMPSGTAVLPQLPPGNEKLEFQMHAEMMQKIGEIASRYAERVQQP